MMPEIGTRVRVSYPGWDTAQVVENANDALGRVADPSPLLGNNWGDYWVVQADAGEPLMWIHEMHLTPLEDECTR
jgi:hypothetical protein